MNMSSTTLPFPQSDTELRITDRVMKLFADVRPGEGLTALLLTTNLFLLLASYYVLKTVREALILSEGGAAVKSYAAAVQAILLLLVVPAYGLFASKVRRQTLLIGVTLFFITHLIAFFALSSAGFQVGIAFFVWVGIFNVLVIAQFWAFANDVYDSSQGERLFPLIGVGSALGAWVGSTVVTRLFSVFSPGQLMLVGAIGFLLCILITADVHRRLTRIDRPAGNDAKLGKQGGFTMLLQSRYLLLIAIMVLLLNVVNSTGEFLLGQSIVADAKQAVASGHAVASEMKSMIGSAYGSFFSWVNFLGLLFQLFVTSRVFKHFGVRAALFILPLIALGSYGMMAFLPVMGVFRFAKILENSTDYSIQNTARHSLFLPTSREAKYKAKAAIDTFFWRLGDLFQAAIVLVAVQFRLSSQAIAQVNVVLVVLWLGVVIAIAREHRVLTGAAGQHAGLGTRAA
jgi:ATP:ADP antiporter, AAA family